MSSNNLRYQWTGAAMAPLRRFAIIAGSMFTAGQEYELELVEERSDESHNLYMKCVGLAFNNAPEHERKWSSATDLRRWALVQTGYFDPVVIDCKSQRDAIAVAAAAPGILHSQDKYCEAEVNGNQVILKVARSQSRKAMKTKAEFEASKVAVLDRLGQLLGVRPEDLMDEARAA